MTLALPQETTVTTEKVTKPRLSEAIRLGALTHGQIINSWQSGDKGCALGVAMWAVGVSTRNDENTIRATALLRKRVTVGGNGGARLCPVFKVYGRGGECGGSKMGIYNTVMHLNDDHGWTFDQIADYLDTIGA